MHESVIYLVLIACPILDEAQLLASIPTLVRGPLPMRIAANLFAASARSPGPDIPVIESAVVFFLESIKAHTFHHVHGNGKTR